jgi:hypothetical protein
MRSGTVGRELAEKALGVLAEQLQQGQSEQLMKWLTSMKNFYRYSLHNQLLIAPQRPDATFVAGYVSWQQKFHRQVKHGERAIWILAPIISRDNSSGPCQLICSDARPEQERGGFAYLLPQAARARGVISCQIWNFSPIS